MTGRLKVSRRTVQGDPENPGPAPARAPLTIALIGNPNTGKSTLFSALAGVRQRVGNYPGVTVEKKLGQMTHAGRRWTLVDLPGTYSLAPRSPDEMVAVDVLLGRRDDVPPPDVVLCIVDASNLERNLYLVSQVRELGRPTVVALTMVDVARARGLEIDFERLRRQLGVAVIPIEARRRIGLEALRSALAEVAGGAADVPESPFPGPFRDEVAHLEAVLASSGPRQTPLPRYLVERLLLDTRGYLEAHVLGDDRAVRDEVRAGRERLARAGFPVPAVEAMARYGWAGAVLDGVVRRPAARRVTAGDRVDRVVTHRAWGTLIFAAVMLLMFHAVFTWSRLPMGWIDAAFGMMAGRVEAGLAEGPFRSLLVDGVIGGVGAVVIFLPQIFILFFFLAILEDCGYLARAAYLMDRLMVHVGLSGKSFIPLLSSFACAIPGVMATRVIEDRRDRLTTILVAPLMSCSARLPVYTLMIAAFIPDRRYFGVGLPALTMFAMYGLGIATAAVVALLLKRTVLRGPTPPFIMELPSYKWPSPRMVVHRMLDRGWAFLRRAGTMILAVSVVMWAALYYPRAGTEVEAPFVAQRERLGAALDAATRSRDTATAEAVGARLAAIDAKVDGIQKRQSLLGRAGRFLEPAVRPLGWDWRIGCAALASFPAREVVVATLGVVFDVGEDAQEGNRLQTALRSATREGTGRPLFTVPVALSIMVFFALCAQCVSTLAVIRRETNSWAWPAFTFAYMTALAYLAALVTYQVGSWLG